MAAADFKSGASGVSPWRVPARSPLAVGFFNAASRLGTHWRAALDCGAAGAPERTVALRLLSPAACAALEERFRTGEAPLPEVRLEMIFAGAYWTLGLSSASLLSLHGFFADEEMAGIDPRSLPEPLCAAVADELTRPVREALGRLLGDAVSLERFAFRAPSVEGRESALPAPLAAAFALDAPLDAAAAAPAAPASGAVKMRDAQSVLLTLFAPLAREGEKPRLAVDAFNRLLAALRALQGQGATATADDALVSESALVFEAAFVAGRTTLSQKEYAGLAAGDVIVADAWLPAENALELCILGAGGRAWCAPLRLNPELNEAALEADLEDAAGAMHAAAAEVRREEKEMLNTDELDVTLTFEIERQAVKLGDLKRMKAGYVMRLAADPASPVTVLANGRPVARGRLVDVNGVLGVELLECAGEAAESAESPSGAANDD